jgi:hypothetical protein
MSYIGSTPTNQSFIAGTDSFNGTGSATNFTLSRSVNSTNDIQVVVNNVVQYPPNYSVSGNTLTISPAPSAGTNNVYVRYLSTTLQSITVPGGSTVVGGFNVTGNVGIGTSLPQQLLDVRGRIQVSNGTNGGQFGVNAGGLAISSIGAAPVSFYYNTFANESMRIDSSGNVGIGTDSPVAKLDVNGPSSVTSFTGTTRLGITVRGSTSTNDYSGIDFLGAGSNLTARIAVLSTGGGSFLTFGTSNSYVSGITNTAMSIDPTGNFQFNSGYGSVATAYGCRAWVNFNGTGTVAIRASGNVSSITDNGGTGTYTINFSVALPDANYCLTFGGSGNATTPASSCFAGGVPTNNLPTSTAARIVVGSVGTSGGITGDPQVVNVAIFR